MAREFAKTLRDHLPEQKVEVVPTARPQHGEELAYTSGCSHTRSLVVSSGGDGGYNEIVNGALRARQEGHDVTTAVLPAGNANDHYRNLRGSQDLAEQIITGVEPRWIDVLKITGKVEGTNVTRYAHSYIGFGLTPYVGDELNRESLNFFKEIKIVAQALWQLEPVKLRIAGHPRSYDSIIVSNITSMSKYLKVAPGANVSDGEFEVTIFRNRGKMGLIWRLLKMVGGMSHHRRHTGVYELETIMATQVQVDGEILLLDAASQAGVSIEARILPCVI